MAQEGRSRKKHGEKAEKVPGEREWKVVTGREQEGG